MTSVGTLVVSGIAVNNSYCRFHSEAGIEYIYGMYVCIYVCRANAAALCGMEGLLE